MISNSELSFFNKFINLRFEDLFFLMILSIFDLKIYSNEYFY